MSQDIGVKFRVENSRFMADLAKTKDAVRSNSAEMASAVGKIKESFNDGMKAMLGFKGAMVAMAAATGFAVLIKKSLESADELSKMSQKIGMSTESLSTLKYAAALADVSLESLGTGLKKMSKNAADAADGTGEAKDSFKALGIQLKDNDGNLKKSDALLLELSSKFEGLSDGSEKTALAMKIFGRSGADMIPLLNMGGNEIKKLQDRARELGLELSTDAGRAAEEFNDRLTDLKAEAEGFIRVIAVKMLPGLNEYVQTVRRAYEESDGLTAAWVALGGVGEAVYGTLLKWASERLGLEFGLSLEQRIDMIRAKIADLKKPVEGFGDILRPRAGLDNTEEIAKLEKELANLEAQKASANAADKTRGDERRKREEAEKTLREAATLALRKKLEMQGKIDANNKLAETTIQNLQKEIALHDALTRVEKIRWETTQGQYKDLSKNQKAKILNLAAELDTLDMLTRLQKEAEALSKEEDSLRESIDKENDSLALQVETFGMTSTEAAIYKMRIEGATDVQISFAKAMLDSIEQQKKIKTVLENIQTPMDRYRKELSDLQELLDAGKISEDEFSAAVKKADEVLKSATDKGEDQFKELGRIIDGWGKDSAKAISDFALKGEISFSNMIDSMINDMLQMLIYQNMMKPLFGSISSVFDFGNLGGLLGISPGTLSAKGNVFSNGNVIPFERGGIITRPTVFPMAHGMGLMGEAGAEGVLPLARLPGGDLGVQAGGGGSVTVNIIDKTGAAITTQRRETQQGTEIDVLIDQAVAKKLNQFGSSSNKALKQNYGARERLVSR